MNDGQAEDRSSTLLNGPRGRNWRCLRNSSRDREGYRFRILEFRHWRESITSWCSQTIKVGIEPANLVVHGVEEVPVVECQLLLPRLPFRSITSFAVCLL